MQIGELYLSPLFENLAWQTRDVYSSLEKSAET